MVVSAIWGSQPRISSFPNRIFCKSSEIKPASHFVSIYSGALLQKFNGFTLISTSSRSSARVSRNAPFAKGTFEFEHRNGETTKGQDNFLEDPMSMILNENIAGVARFLLEQPSQLKYIDWPDFKDTVKTSVLTLVIVAALIVTLTCVDSTLSYLSRFFFLKPILH